MPYVFLICLAALVCGCGTDSSSSLDAAPGDAAASDATSGLPTSCEGDCATVTLRVTFGAVTRSFERAFFGLSSPAKSASGDWAIYVEGSGGGEDACPTETSPTPDRLVIVSGLAVPSQVASVTAGAVNLLDFEGALLPTVPTARATANTVAWAAADVCIECAMGTEPDRPGRQVAFDLQATFDGGSAVGRIYATHCASLDDL